MSDEELQQTIERHAKWQNPEVKTAAELTEVVLNTEFKTKDTQTALALVAGEAIQASEAGSHYVLNNEAAQVILTANKQRLEATQTTPPNSLELNQAEASATFQQAIDDLIESGVITADFAAQIAKVLPTKNLQVVQGNFARFHYDGDHFPQEVGKEGKIEIGDQIIASHADKIKQIAEKIGLVLTTEQCTELAHKRVLMHEYGHAALQTKKIQAFESAEASGESNEYGSLTTKVDKQVNGVVAEQIAPCPELTELFEAEPTEQNMGASELGTVDERVASGFELVGLFQALQKAQVPEAQAAMMIQTIMQEEAVKFREKKMVIEFARSKGLSIQQLDRAISNLFGELHSKQADLAELCRGGFGPQTAGYNFPLSPSELTRLANLETKK